MNQENEDTLTTNNLQKNCDSQLISLENVEDFSKVCRTCATVTEYVIPIFDGEGIHNNLEDKIKKHLPIQVTREDHLPHVVCYQCASTLLAWHELVECCVQAEEALQTRLTTLKAEQQKQNSASSSQDGSSDKIKFKEITDFVVQSLEPPLYEDSVLSPAVKPSRTCQFCATEQPAITYRDHLLFSHSDLLFHCDECDELVDRKCLLLHMSWHAVQYSQLDKKVAKKDLPVKNENLKTGIKIKEVVKTSTTDDINRSKESEECRKENVIEMNTNEAPNEFSDHEENEYGFGPLPESVFEAIEDSQESQTSQIEKNNDSGVPDNREKSLINKTSVENAITQSFAVAEDTQKIETNQTDGSQLPENQENIIKTSQKKTLINSKKNKVRICPICSKSYTVSSSYFYHMKYFHKGCKDHECQVCGRKFGTKGSLEQHSSIHTGECNLECRTCKKKFRSKASLYIHEQSHNGVKTYSCDHCQMSFRWRTHLNRHLSRHAGEKTFKCSNCERSFAVRCDLLRHMRTHEAGVYNCDKCDTQFAQLRYLKAHIDKKHNTQVNKGKVT